MSERRRLALTCLTGLLIAGTGPVAATEIGWPTSMVSADHPSPNTFLQPTVSGKLESATFGMVREEGQRFHEGIDIRPTTFSADGESLDLALAAMQGQVAYLNPHVNGPYGKYLVLYHTAAELPLYTLYAHLAKLEPSLKIGQVVPRGRAIGLIGRTSAGSSPITKDRAHLHFEVGLLLSTGFNHWYAAQPENKQSANLHGLYNGQNLIGLDPWALLSQPKVDLLTLVRQQPTALTVALRSSQPPDFIQRYPALARGDSSRAAGWIVEFSWQGMPVRWTALEAKSPQLPATRWHLREIALDRRAQLIQRKMLGADGRSPGELLRQNVEILLSTSR